MARISLLSTAAMAGFVVLSGCGDSFTSGTFPQMQITIDSQAFGVDGAELFFTSTIQSAPTKAIEISNVGTSDLVIQGIDWEVDANGARVKNPDMEIDFLNAIGADGFPRTLAAGDVFDTLTFNVKWNKPLSGAFDTSPSAIIIKSNARDTSGEVRATEVRIMVTIRTDSPAPRVTPENYTFQSATNAIPENQQFTIYNDDQLATGPFTVTGIRLNTPSDELTPKQMPSIPTTVLAPNQPGYKSIVFAMEYKPKGEPPAVKTLLNTIIIDTDNGQLSVALYAERVEGAVSLSYSHVDNFDFANVAQTETRSVSLFSEGPAPLRIKQPKIEPGEARQDFTWEAYLPATTQGGTDELIDSWPRGLAPGRTIRIDITYQPANDGSDTANGELIVPYEAPDAKDLVIPLFSGQPKSKIELSPAAGNLAVSGSGTGGDSGARKVMIYNQGNGPLDLQGVAITGAFNQTPKVWSQASPFSATMVPPGGLFALNLNYDLSAVTTPGDVEIETLAITYYDDFTGQNEEKTLGLVGGDDKGVAAPVAMIAQPAAAAAGETMTLSAAGTTPGGGTIGTNAYIWYLTGKPATSLAKLNVAGNASTTFLPDVAGDYTVEMYVFVSASDTFLYSAPASVTFTVGAAQ